jgi:hypothetical protein
MYTPNISIDQFTGLNTGTYTYFNIINQSELEVRCFSSEGYPNGDNRIFIVPMNIILSDLLLQVLLLTLPLDFTKIYV